ncbi:MAG TPA: tetratricopeptide repeat protein [Gemmatimonadales bacterium]|nr:tetratricopeptide repeat protein [Gemmatimonadales bacterium]
MFRSPSRFPMFALSALIPLAAACGGSDRPRTTSSGVSTPTVTATVDTATPSTTSVAVTPVSYEAAESAFGAGRYAEASEMFASYTGAHPENPWGHYMLGLSAWKAGDRGKASIAFDQALQLDPSHRKSLFNSSRVLLESGKPREALERVERALSLEPMSNEGLRLLGRVRYELGEVDAAIKAYQRALTIDERDVWSMNNLGLIYIQQDRSCEALPPLARAVELRSNAPAFQNNLGTALERSGHPTAAAQAYEAAIAADSTYAKASVALARVTGGGQEPESAPVDLVALSQKFQADIESWRATQDVGDSSAVPAEPTDSAPVSDSTTAQVGATIDSVVVSGGKLGEVLEQCAPEI